jgi:hypothetical protein
LESQALKVRHRHEAILACVCESLKLQCSYQELSDAETQSKSFEDNPSSHKDSKPLPVDFGEAAFEHGADSASFVAAVHLPSRSPTRNTNVLTVGKRLPRKRTLIYASVVSLLMALLVFWSVRLWTSRFQAVLNTSKHLSRKSLHPLDPNGAHTADRTSAIESEATLPKVIPALQHPEDVKLWVDDWAASERTKDPGIQTSFYADNVSPYLNHVSCDRISLYHDKQNAIRERKGLWTFSVEKVSIHKKNPNIVLVKLIKHFMTQAGTVEVAEQWIPSRLVLVRTNGGWMISAEEDLERHAK